MKNRSKKYLRVGSFPELDTEDYLLEVVHSQMVRIKGEVVDQENVLAKFRVKPHNLERQKVKVKTKYKLHEEVRGD